MDPNKTLDEIRELVSKILEPYPEGAIVEEAYKELACLAIQLADKISALDNWIRNGGFLPRSW